MYYKTDKQTIELGIDNQAVPYHIYKIPVPKELDGKFKISPSVETEEELKSLYQNYLISSF